MTLGSHSHADVSDPAHADVPDPAAVLAGGLTMPVLRALSSRASPATAAQLRRAAAAGTEAGVRRALERIAVQGLLTTVQIGDRVVYLLNRDHVPYPAVTALLRAQDELAAPAARRDTGLAGSARRRGSVWLCLAPGRGRRQ